MDDTPRKRYLVIRLSRPDAVDRKEMINLIRSSANGISKDLFEKVEPWLTVYDGSFGIVRFNHKYRDEIISIVEAIDIPDCHLETVGISGTIKKARKKYLVNARD